jgi:hypothetical protein
VTRKIWAAISLGAGVALLTGGIAVTARVGALPYNVRELFGAGNPLPTALAMAAIAYWAFGAPAVFAAGLAGARAARAALLAGAVALHAAITYAALRAAVPIESMYDVVGSPILHWPWEWELLGRFAALLGAVTLLWMGAAACAAALDGGSRRAVAMWVVGAVALLPIAHVVVVSRAATDNLTELMAGGGGPGASLAIAAAIFCVGLAGSSLARLGAGGRRGPLAAALLLSIPAAYVALSLGLERHVEKYGQVFSALQFLLSRDRESLASGGALLARYAVAHAGVVLLLALTQHPVAILGAGRGRRMGAAAGPAGAPAAPTP